MNYQQRGWNTAATVFERKLDESLKIMNTQGTLAGYRTTEAFVNELQKHLKITKVCKNDDLTSCFEEEITWNIIDVSAKTESETMNVSELKTANDLGKNDWNTNTVGIQLNNGTSAVLAYNPNCRQDQYSNQITGTSCVAVLYDTSGYSKPNSSGKDVRGINLLLNKCVFKSNTACFGTPFTPSSLTKAECEAQKDDLGIQDCNHESDYWAGAIAACGHVNKMPTDAHLAEIANYIYNTDQVQVNNDLTNIKRDDDRASALGFKNVTSTSTFSVWTGIESRINYGAYYRTFTPASTYLGNHYRNHNLKQAVCLSD